MPKMHFCTCEVNLAGQNMTFARFYPDSPVSWPEVLVLQHLHGDENVQDIKVVSIADVYPVAEKDRLARKYGYGNVERVFPGKSFRMDLLMPGETEQLPLAAFDGIRVVHQGDDDDPDDHVGSLEPPAGPAVFKPGRHQIPVTPPES